MSPATVPVVSPERTKAAFTIEACDVVAARVKGSGLTFPCDLNGYMAYKTRIANVVMTIASPQNTGLPQILPFSALSRVIT